MSATYRTIIGVRVFELKKTLEYELWFLNQTPKFQAQVEKRLSNIKNFGYFGHLKNLGDGLAEIKFNSGDRIYFAKTSLNEITLLLGGNKNGQSKDIKKAKNFLYK